MHKYMTRRGLGFFASGFLYCALPGPLMAAQTMKPGLWEVTSEFGGGGRLGAQMAAAQREMQKQLAALPPEQRAQVERMMGQRGGMIGAKPGGGMSTRICVTEEMAARNQPPARQQGNCKHEYSKRSGDTTRFSFVCADPVSSGEGEVTLHDPESYAMRMTATSQSTSDQMMIDARGKWLSTDCGSVRPAQ